MRELLRALADEGRTVLVSSHLMSEMEDTADHLVVLGRGRLLADVPMEELLGAHSAVRVRTPQGPTAGRRPPAGRRPGRARDRRRAAGRGARRWPRSATSPSSPTSALHELSRVTASLEAAYLALTDDDVEYRAVTS